MLGTSNPVSHMSHTITSLKSEFVSLIRRSIVLIRSLPRMCCCNFSSSDALPVIITLIAPFSSSSLCQSGRNSTIFSYKFAAMCRLIVTTIPLPSSTLTRSSKCFTMSSATSRKRSPLPTIASFCAYSAFSWSWRVISSPSSRSSTSLSSHSLVDSSMPRSTRRLS